MQIKMKTGLARVWRFRVFLQSASDGRPRSSHLYADDAEDRVSSEEYRPYRILRNRLAVPKRGLDPNMCR